MLIPPTLRYLVISTLLLLSACEDSSISIPHKAGLAVPATVLDIHSPINDSTLPVGSPYILDYVIINSKPGDYLKVQVDSHKPETVIGQKGQHYMRGLTAGKHLVKITAYRNKSATGGQAIITIHAQ